MNNRLSATIILLILFASVMPLPAMSGTTTAPASSSLPSTETIEVSQPIQLTTDSHYDRSPSFLEDKYGTYWLFFTRGRGDPTSLGYNPDNDFYDIYYLKSTDGGATWTEYSMPSSINNAYGQREVAVFEEPSANLIVVYFTDTFYGSPYGTPTNKIYWTYTSDSGTTWSTPSPGGIPGVTGYHVDALWDDVEGSVYVFYEGPGALIYVIKYHSGWGSPIQISETGKHGGIPKAMIDSSGDLNVVWCGWSEGGIYRSTSSDGTTWSTPQLILTSSYVACDPVLVEDTSGYTLFWAPWDSITDSQWLEVINSTDGVTWSSSRHVTSGGYGSNYWWDMWPEAYVESSGDMLLFYGTELSGGGAGGYVKGDGNIWMFEVVWDLNNPHYEFIQEAIDDAPLGETILVHDGTYEEALYIDKSLTIKSASKPIIKGSKLFATDYGNREAVIFVEDASYVTLEDLDIEGDGLGPARNYGVLYQNSGGTIRNCIVSPNTIGDMGSVGIAGISRSDLLIETCTVENFGRIGIYATNVENIAIYDNEIIGQVYSGEGEVNYGIEIEDYDGPSSAQIYWNEIYNSDNTFSPEPSWSSAAIIVDIWRMYYDLVPSDVSIKYNDIHDNYLGIEVVSNPSMHAHYNNIYNNRYGVTVDPDLYDNYEAFDARSNWWGHHTGPDHPTSWTYLSLTIGPNLGSGDSVTDYVLYDPWLEEAWPPSVLPTLRVEPSSYQAKSYHETFDINVTVSDIVDDWRVIGLQFRLQFNSSLLEVVGVTEGPFMQQAGSTFFIYFVDFGDILYGDNVIVGVTLLPQIETTNGAWWNQFPEGSGTVATITFKAIYQEIGLENPPVGCDLTLAETQIIDDTTQEIDHTTEDGYYEILPWPRPALWVEIESDSYQAKQLNETFSIDINVRDLHASLMKPIAIQFRLLFNGTLLEVTNVAEGPFMEQFGDTFFISYVTYDDIVWGANVVVGVILLPNATGHWTTYANGTGTVATITFKAIYQHVGLEKPPLSCNLTLNETTILDEDLVEINHTIANWGYYEILPNNIADINWDYKVDIKDIAIAAKAFGGFPGHERWNPIADINGDEKIDIKDIATIAREFGWEPDP